MYSFKSGSIGLDHHQAHENDNEDERPRTHWESLTVDIHAIVLDKLPFFSQIRLRTVCKTWNALLSSQHDKRGTSHDQTQKLTSRTVVIYFGDGRLMLFNPRKNLWQEQCLDFIQYPLNTLSLLVASGGLLCFKTRSTGELVVCNPISAQCKYLKLPEGFDSQALTMIDPVPDLLKPVVTLEGGKETIEAFQCSMFGKEVIVGLLTETHKQWYKLVVAGISTPNCNATRRTTLVYDSFMGQWKEGSALPKGVRFWESGKTVNANGYLYCVTVTAGNSAGESNLEWPWSVVRFDSSTNSWMEIQLGRRGSILPQLVEHRGRILLVQKNGKAETEISFSELRGDSTAGPTLCSCLSLGNRDLPSTIFPLNSRKWCPMIIEEWCVGHGQWLFIVGRHRELPSLAKFNANNNLCSRSRSPPPHLPPAVGLDVLAHNFTKNVWIQLPTLTDIPHLCAHTSGSSTCHALNGYHTTASLQAFEPSLSAAVW